MSPLSIRPVNSYAHMVLELKRLKTWETYLVPKQDSSSSPKWPNFAMPSIAEHIIPDLAILSQKYKLMDLNIVKTHFINEGRLSVKQALKIVADAEGVLRIERNLLEINRKCYVIGDIHGQFYDLISMLSNFSFPRDTLVFLGDYVDRGSFSTEVYLYLLLLKSYYPENIFLLRGNHESRKMTSYFTFRSECLHKYNEEVYERILESFMCLPLAAVIQRKAFCCHGGISPDLKRLSDINKINRQVEVEYTGLICDIMWADPHTDYSAERKTWVENHKRRCSFFYHYSHVCSFLEENNLFTVIRGHEVQLEGFKAYDDYKGAPSLMTVFSAPNYCDVYNNLGALIEYDEKIISVIQFPAVDHPFVLRGFINGIDWSLPFIFEKILDFTSSILSEAEREWASDAESSETTKNSLPIADAIIQDENIPNISEMKKPITVMRVERENIDEFDDDEESTFDCGTLDVREAEMNTFQEAANKDAKNEIIKEMDEDTPQLSLRLSPSLKNENLQNISAEEIVKDIQENIIIDNVGDDLQSVRVESLRAKKKKSWLRFCCLK
ncbi:serine/threonine-protein phosphatase 2B catalytic subunit [Pancytospora epiphaga]|nr:serine/threonine-protein phosphatase 2B catalytic subunit [Pancytospora epiphaga]